MKIYRIILLIAFGFLIAGCSLDKTPEENMSNQQDVKISGQIQAGYRVIPLMLGSESANLTVYRGDYIKFQLNDQGDSTETYLLDIPELDIHASLLEHAEDQPFFKMKNKGVYKFKIGDRSGQINVIEFKQSNYAELSNQEAWELLNDNPPILLDVRTQGEYNRGYIEGAVLIPLQEIQSRIGELEQYQNQPILIYCATGNRSTTASKILLDRGFKDIMNLRSGIVGWARSGYGIKFPS
ncbi:MAG: rhodanese-like domain-containing protein [Candidatus Marinimicrobia bacterium]|nr:rhodanese-like domain-containing protein [Candidatus Neomarinimicrobiota bacterium]